LKCPGCGAEQPDEGLQCPACGAIVDPQADALDVGATVLSSGGGGLLAGRYRIRRRLGRGGMGAVYLAEDTVQGIDVALKVLPAALSHDERAVSALRDEANIAIRLTHPNIMRLHIFEARGDCKFLVMERITGPTLDQVLARQGTLTPEEVAEVARQACDGLSHAHRQKVVHRDIKPSNIMLAFPEDTPYDPSRPLAGQMHFTVKITDFGIARQAKDAYSRTTRSASSGTLMYMAPEQLRDRRADLRSDIYSLGATMYELLTGAPPFSRGAVQDRIESEEPNPLEDVPDSLGRAIMRCLAKSPHDRFGGADELAKALRGGRVRVRVAPPPVIPPAQEEHHLTPWQVRGLVGLFQAAFWGLQISLLIQYREWQIAPAMLIATLFSGAVMALTVPRAKLREVPQVALCFAMFAASAGLARQSDDTMIWGVQLGTVAATLAARMLIARVALGHIFVAALLTAFGFGVGSVVVRGGAGGAQLGETARLVVLTVGSAGLPAAYIGSRCRAAMRWPGGRVGW